MRSFRLEELRRSQRERYREFLREGMFSGGLYVLRAGEADPQKPHAEDEVYVVVSGRGKFRSGDETIDVSAGSVLFVAAREDHRYLEIEEDLTVLVFFAPPESRS